ncbi:hypothetical protein [Hymenobacter sp. CRA2]|uniref:hypothetical protein n=1 Tax=Hymenobacter sp. CRA2 TaxID=1955620 RepID=UPI00098F4855|nr:hypothetical protein [Hymenobacter sp. CRA2]OON69902.1 hypothetical protein B0919_03880 [Hymenobacter sp. CRA2]
MQPINPSASIADYYLGVLRNLSADSKLDLIARLSQSLKQEQQPAAPTSLQALFGAYQGEETAEELIAAIRQSRVSTRDIEPL